MPGVSRGKIWILEKIVDFEEKYYIFLVYLPPGYSRVLSTNFSPFGPAVLPALANILTY